MTDHYLITLLEVRTEQKRQEARNGEEDSAELAEAFKKAADTIEQLLSDRRANGYI